LPPRKNDPQKLAREVLDEGNGLEFLDWQTLIEGYADSINKKSPSTTIVYRRTLRQFAEWLSALPGHQAYFRPEQLTRAAFESYLAQLDKRGYSVSYRQRVKAVVSAFARWLIEERDVLMRNPTRGIEIKTEGQLAPRILEAEQRVVLRDLVERSGDLRGEAIFALGYWAGCRVSDVSWLRMEHTHVGPKIGWLHVGYKGGKMRDLDLLNQARRSVYDYLQDGHRDRESPFVFTSQRSERLSEDGIHNWLQTLKGQASKDEWELLKEVTFHDLRHDFAHRARAAGWTLEELAYYLGHTTKRGLPAIQTTVRYTQISRRQLKEKLQLLKE